MIRISVDDVNNGAKIFHENSSEMSAMVDGLKSIVNDFASIWEGKAFEAFSTEFATLEPDVRKFVQLIDDIGTQLNQVATAMEQADADIASQLGVR